LKLSSRRKIIPSDEKSLVRFIRDVLARPDTPSLIQLVASNADYLILSSHIVNAEPEDNRNSFQLLMAICERQHIEFRQLQEKLVPVARSLGLAKPHTTQIDYYSVLGVTPEADVSEIRRAFREKAYEVHPDTGNLGQQGNQAFANLRTAYQTLRDSTYRKQYDQSRKKLGTWIEKPTPNQNRQATNKYFCQMGGLLIILILTAFFFDFFYRQDALTVEFDSTKEKEAQILDAPQLEPSWRDKTVRLNQKSEKESSEGHSSQSGLDTTAPKPAYMKGNSDPLQLDTNDLSAVDQKLSERPSENKSMLEETNTEGKRILQKADALNKDRGMQQAPFLILQATEASKITIRSQLKNTK
jgi:molecular chaperone DnaJ